MNIRSYIPQIVFAVRCAGSATLGYLIAYAIGLPYPIWTLISAIVVSQEQLVETRISVIRRIIGTLAGVVIAVSVNALLAPGGISIPTQCAVSIAVSATLAFGRPMFRASLFTCPIVLLTATPSDVMAMVAFHRGCEVILGGLLGGLFHYGADKSFDFFAYLGEKTKSLSSAQTANADE